MGKKQQDKPASSQRGTSHLILIQHSTGANTSPEACTYVPAHPLDVLTKRLSGGFRPQQQYCADLCLLALKILQHLTSCVHSPQHQELWFAAG